MGCNYDVIVVGGGHAGSEAAYISAVMGLKTLLITNSIHHIALMPCNPAIGGPGKGHVVMEIDALGGLMAKVTDQCTLHIKKVNTGKGPAVQTLRAQTQRDQYSLIIRKYLENTPFLSIFQGEVSDLILNSNGEISGVKTFHGIRFQCRSVVIATGTFLNGVIKIGEISYPAGRQGEFPANHLSQSLRQKGFETGRLNTCTPPRIDKRTIDFKKCDEQKSDDLPLCFSWESTPRAYEGSSVFLTRTNENTCEIIRKNFDRSPLLYHFSDSSPVRECPSLEDKVYRFPDRVSHLVFLEPEGEKSNEIYVQGVFTSLPEETQWQILRSISGLENCHIIRPGYGIEYDFILPTQLKLSLESKPIPGLFFAGQINGTSGYEEAAGQGILAGINAGRYVQNKPAIILQRDESYLGVMVDDLITKGVEEPYRLRTGKVEYRLLIRHSNADVRLAEYGYQAGTISLNRYRMIQEKKNIIAQEVKRLENTNIFPSVDLNRFLEKKHTNPLPEPTRINSLLTRPQINYYDLSPFDPDRPFLSPDILEEVEIQTKYRGYIERQIKSVNEFRQMENRPIPPHFPFDQLKILSREAQEQLQALRPTTLGQASRIRGVTPSDLAALLILLEKFRKEE
ncbi:MAG TPA: tRNA uridine-5-carboxymethylaminomethyl(34) synthesis enzyme MnmG [Atribacter sp.]|mgnify:FL=1|uniref:tRNA uridine-5-carboxymethylaminomethyl(34) synthesis enzyme MnmG n=1 Tax=Atribacter sp. TaxID=2847780 RepID=UPI002B5E20CF|nr:tRNA uridine-5-carboxymethylaminomethyl(34) synthesis enzyme MnmG [Atribacter sp.]HQK84290.1 tRNA uridine-5-carboxymethylaminomethyl(34) synthesis enzyme MnmG [Atribacter sp.]